jgi:hypothetical protein
MPRNDGPTPAVTPTAESLLWWASCSFDFRRRFRRLMGYLKPIKALFVFRVGSTRVINAAA